MTPFKQVILLVLDGFGVASSSEGNAVFFASTKNLNYLINNFPSLTLQASGPSVGLPWGERGNSEVGHLNMGAGRIVSLDLPRISSAIASGEFFENPALLAAIAHAKRNKSKLHLVGLISSGGVHSSEEHLYALLTLAADQGVRDVFIHMITDGRDTGPKVAIESLDKLSRKLLELKTGKIATLAGRFFAMDRGLHWEVIESAYNALVLGKGERASSALEAIRSYYQKQIFDETIPPTVIMENDKPVGKIEDGDAVIFFNFRPDRQVQLVQAMTDPGFDKFRQTRSYLQNMSYATMTLYAKNLPVAVAFPPLEIPGTLPEVMAGQKLTQFHIAESEKYAHVTSFFNGGREGPCAGEEREIITSPSSYQKRYQDVPEMSVDRLRERILEKLNGGTNFILANFANPDMVGHTGNKAACIAAINAVDRNIGLIFEAIMPRGAALVVTADHGNIEQILDIRTGAIDKEHTLNPVPFIVAGVGLQRKDITTGGYAQLAGAVPEGVLSDVAPTILDLMGIRKPAEMTAVSLLPQLKELIEKSMPSNNTLQSFPEGTTRENLIIAD